MLSTSRLGDSDMVDVTPGTKVITRTVEEEVTVYNIQLTENEARVLLSVFARVAGDPRGPRSVVQSISDTLKDLGVPFSILRNRHVSNGVVTLADSWGRFLSDDS